MVTTSKESHGACVFVVMSTMSTSCELCVVSVCELKITQEKSNLTSLDTRSQYSYVPHIVDKVYLLRRQPNCTYAARRAGLSFGDVMSTGSSGRLFCVPVVLSGPVSGVKDAKSK